MVCTWMWWGGETAFASEFALLGGGSLATGFVYLREGPQFLGWHRLEFSGPHFVSSVLLFLVDFN